jgi:hypothetical protein
MNTKWLKQNAVLLGCAAALLLVLGALIWLQQQAAGKRQEIDSTLEEQTSELDHLQKLKPSPSPQNIQIIKQDRGQIDALYSNLLTAVSQNQMQTQEVIRPVGFLQLMASKFARLRQSADAAGVKLPDGFAFGFSRYAGSPPTLPARNLSDEEAKPVLGQLTKQLLAIEKLSELLIESRVDEISQIQRAEVEPGAPGPDALNVPISNDSEGLYQTLPFGFRFTATPTALRTFLNKLSQSEWFFAVRYVQVTGELPSGGATDQPGAGGPAAAGSAGGPRRGLLHVDARIDLVEFRSKPAQPAAEKPST